MNFAFSRGLLIAIAVTIGSGVHANSEVPIPRSVSGDKGKYYLLDAKRKGNIVSALHKRIGIDTTGFTRTETNCKTMQMRELGYSEEGPDKIQIKPTQWFDLVQGSSKSDLANFVCQTTD